MAKRRGELIRVKDLFAAYKTRIKPPQASVVKEVQEVIKDVCGVTLSTDAILYTVSTRTVSIQARSIIKHEIQRSEQEIIAHLKGRIGEHSAPLVIR